MQKFQIDDEHLIKSIFKCCEALEGFPHNWKKTATAADVLGLMERVDYKDNIRDKKEGG